ncbi:MAG: hypothetical protein ACI4I9_09785 [Porcipelethomonas sp.]
MEDKLFDFVMGCGCDIELASQKEKELHKIIEEEAEALAVSLAEEKFQDKKETFELEVIEKVNAANSAKKVAGISRKSSYVTENILADGKEIHVYDFIQKIAGYYPQYDGNQLMFYVCASEYQLLHKNGKREFVSNFVVDACIIVNATGLGSCEAIVIYIRGKDVPLIFNKGDISPSAVRRQTLFYLYWCRWCRQRFRNHRHYAGEPLQLQAVQS